MKQKPEGFSDSGIKVGRQFVSGDVFDFLRADASSYEDNVVLKSILEGYLGVYIDSCELYCEPVKKFYPECNNELSHYCGIITIEGKKYPFLNGIMELGSYTNGGFGFTTLYNYASHGRFVDSLSKTVNEPNYYLASDVFYSHANGTFFTKDNYRGLAMRYGHDKNMNDSFLMPGDILFNYWKNGNASNNLKPEDPELLKHIISCNDQFNYIFFVCGYQYEVEEEGERDELQEQSMFGFSDDYNPVEQRQFSKNQIDRIMKEFYTEAGLLWLLDSE